MLALLQTHISIQMILWIPNRSSKMSTKKQGDNALSRHVIPVGDFREYNVLSSHLKEIDNNAKDKIKKTSLFPVACQKT